MKDGLRPYLNMKDSGLPWLGSIPSHWDVRRGKYLFRCIDIRSVTGEEELLTVSSERGVVPRSSATVTMFKAESYVGYKLCWPGDLVINSLWAWARGLGVSRYHGIVSSAYGVYRLRDGYESYSPYIHELVRSIPFQWELQVRSKGIWISRLQMTDDAFLSAPFPVPSKDEQAAIVRFVGHADGLMRRYIRAKQRLIRLLEEQKQVITRRAVTCGLDERVRFKPSGVEWLGDMPEHWAVVPLRWHISIGSGEFIDAESVSDNTTAERPYPVIGGNGVMGYAGTCNSEETTIIVGRVGALCGNVHFVESSAWITDNALRITRIRGFDPAYLALQLRAMNLNRLANASAQPLVTGGMIKSQRVAMPPIEEQRSIVQHLHDASDPATDAIRAAKHEISLISEFRSRLIADLVTGKLDVREAAARLSDETFEAEPLDETTDLAEDEESAEIAELEAKETV